MTILPSYRNQAIDLHIKAIDWFLYEGAQVFNGLNLKYIPVNLSNDKNNPHVSQVRKREQKNSTIR